MNKNTTLHANDQIVARLEDAGFSDTKIAKVGAAIDYIAPRFNQATALRVLDLQKMVGNAWTDRSNGDQVWAIIRNQKVVTVMLRRSTQPATPEALRVDVVTTIEEIA